MAILVNGERVEDAVIREEALVVKELLLQANVDGDPLAIDMRAWDWGKENVIERVLLRQAAAAAAQSVEELVAKLTRNLAKPKKKDIVEHYRKHRDSFYSAEMVRAAHIVKNVEQAAEEDPARTAIQAIEQELRDGKPFEEVADLRSDCPGRGGDLGFFQRGHMVPEFEAVVFSMQPGQVSPIFRTPFGFHIAKLHERRAEGVRELSDVWSEIEQRLIQDRRETCVEQFVDTLRAKADIRKAPSP